MRLRHKLEPVAVSPSFLPLPRTAATSGGYLNEQSVVCFVVPGHHEVHFNFTYV